MPGSSRAPQGLYQGGCVFTTPLFEQPDMLLDIYLREHVAVLLSAIREKALIQYFRSYVTVDLNRMAPAFNTSVADLEAELAALIMDGKIQARIDSHMKACAHLIHVIMTAPLGDALAHSQPTG